MRQLQLGSSTNWELIYNENITAAMLPKEGGGYKAIPIPEVDIGVLLEDSFILAVRISTLVPPDGKWKFAGHIKQSVSTGISAFNGQDATFNNRKPLFLDKINLVVYPRISTNYSISIQLPDWFQVAGIGIWRYTGPDYDSDLARIESKIDAL